MTQELNFNLTANYYGFDTTMYNRQGCGSSTCEGVAILKLLHVSVVKRGPKMRYLKSIHIKVKSIKGDKNV